MKKAAWNYPLAGALALILSLGAAPSLHAQLVTGTLSGSVLDETGAVIPEASVPLTNEASKDIRRTRSNGEGLFTFASVVPGTYTVTVEMGGFKKTERTGVQIRVGDSRSLGQIRLAVGGLSEAAVVTAQVEMVPLSS